MIIANSNFIHKLLNLGLSAIFASKNIFLPHFAIITANPLLCEWTEVSLWPAGNEQEKLNIGKISGAGIRGIMDVYFRYDTSGS